MFAFLSGLTGIWKAFYLLGKAVVDTVTCVVNAAITAHKTTLGIITPLA